MATLGSLKRQYLSHIDDGLLQILQE